MKTFVAILMNLCVIVTTVKRNQDYEVFEGQKILGSHFYTFMKSLKGLYNSAGYYFEDGKDPALYYGTTNDYNVIRYLEPYKRTLFDQLTKDQINKCLLAIPNIDDVRLQIKSSIEFLCVNINQDAELGDGFKYKYLILKDYLRGLYTEYGPDDATEALFETRCVKKPQRSGYGDLDEILSYKY